MKKERTKRICNYFMKGLLLCALVFGFWFMADAGVNADVVGIWCYRYVKGVRGS